MEEQISLINPYWLLGIKRRGGEFAGIKNENVYFYVTKGSVLDNEENLHILRDFLKNYYSYTLKVAIR